MNTYKKPGGGGYQPLQQVPEAMHITCIPLFSGLPRVAKGKAARGDSFFSSSLSTSNFELSTSLRSEIHAPSAHFNVKRLQQFPSRLAPAFRFPRATRIFFIATHHPLLTLFSPFTLCVPLGTVFNSIAAENGIVMPALYVLQPRRSRSKYRSSPENTWN
jgi:hypothetical protein